MSYAAVASGCGLGAETFAVAPPARVRSGHGLGPLWEPDDSLAPCDEDEDCADLGELCAGDRTCRTVDIQCPPGAIADYGARRCQCAPGMLWSAQAGSCVYAGTPGTLATVVPSAPPAVGVSLATPAVAVAAGALLAYLWARRKR